MAAIERIIKDQTGYALHLSASDMRVSRLKSRADMIRYFAQWRGSKEEL
ncbi:MAG: hypothetical protein KGK03_04155 [Candidatus Omnitrophica bacterium]|nr:hypothetical protein [Candidatus Omnitrophota bacterium]MDE2222246.1 hypothetical protein [Candidatus Omnitrophota bacterium]